MKKREFLGIVAILLGMGGAASAQNLLPLDWNISTSQGVDGQVNLLVSWEHQGYFWHDGDCTLSTAFEVENPENAYLLTSRLQCTTKSISINGTVVAENLTTQFWSDREASTAIALPQGILKQGRNDITVSCTGLSYTGGISHNLLTLTPAKNAEKEEVKLTINAPQHICLDQSPSITLHYKAIRDGHIRLRVENDFHQPMLDTTWRISATDSIATLDLSRTAAKAGFYQCMAVMQAQGFSGDVQWLGVRPEEIECDNVKSPDFEAHWAAALDELKDVAPKFKVRRVDSLCTKSRNGYVVEMQSIGNLTVRGYYFVPREGKQHAAVLHVPGYGWGFEDLSQFLDSNADIAEFALCVRGHGLSADVFNPGFGTPGIWGYKLYEKDSMAYRGLYMDCVRAVEFLRSRKEIKPDCIGVMGGSQGGGLTLATAALCKDMVAACAYFDPFPCDIRHQILTRTMCRTELTLDLEYYHNPISFDEMMKLQDLIDTRSFAASIKCPVHFMTALFDDDCPPHGGFAAYNTIQSTKCYTIYPYDSHLSESNYGKMALKWFEMMFKK